MKKERHLLLGDFYKAGERPKIEALRTVAGRLRQLDTPRSKRAWRAPRSCAGCSATASDAVSSTVWQKGSSLDAQPRLGRPAQMSGRGAGLFAQSTSNCSNPPESDPRSPTRFAWGNHDPNAPSARPRRRRALAASAHRVLLRFSGRSRCQGSGSSRYWLP